MYNIRYRQIRRLTFNTIGCLKRNVSSDFIIYRDKFSTESNKIIASHCHQLQIQSISLNNRSQKRSISTASVDRRGSKYASNILPAKKRVVICGGGVMGAAVAYHLVLRGWADETVVLEKGK